MEVNNDKKTGYPVFNKLDWTNCETDHCVLD